MEKIDIRTWLAILAVLNLIPSLIVFFEMIFGVNLI
jgi:hypothetical protein